MTMAGGGLEQPGARAATLGGAWSALTNDTLRKTVPQLLLGVWFWGLVLGEPGLNTQTLRPPAPIVMAMVAAFVFYVIVIRRVLGVLAQRQMSVWLMHFSLLFFGYTLWLGFWPPVHRRDVREWIGWTAMAAGLVACLFLVVPNASVIGSG